MPRIKESAIERHLIKRKVGISKHIENTIDTLRRVPSLQVSLQPIEVCLPLQFLAVVAMRQYTLIKRSTTMNATSFSDIDILYIGVQYVLLFKMHQFMTENERQLRLAI